MDGAVGSTLPVLHFLSLPLSFHSFFALFPNHVSVNLPLQKKTVSPTIGPACSAGDAHARAAGAAAMAAVPAPQRPRHNHIPPAARWAGGVAVLVTGCTGGAALQTTRGLEAVPRPARALRPPASCCKGVRTRLRCAPHPAPPPPPRPASAMPLSPPRLAKFSPGRTPTESHARARRTAPGGGCHGRACSCGRPRPYSARAMPRAPHLPPPPPPPPRWGLLRVPPQVTTAALFCFFVFRFFFLCFSSLLASGFVTQRPVMAG